MKISKFGKKVTINRGVNRGTHQWYSKKGYRDKRKYF